VPAKAEAAATAAVFFKNSRRGAAFLFVSLMADKPLDFGVTSFATNHTSCLQDQDDRIVAPKGLNRKAQGNALGNGFAYAALSPDRAT
jgi:hypothetical protein